MVRNIATVWASGLSRMQHMLLAKKCRQLSFGCWSHESSETLQPLHCTCTRFEGDCAHSRSLLQALQPVPSPSAVCLTCGAPEVDQHSPVPQPSHQERKGQLPACGVSAVRPAVGAQNGRPWCSLFCSRVQQNGLHREVSSSLGGGSDLQCRCRGIIPHAKLR